MTEPGEEFSRTVQWKQLSNAISRRANQDTLIWTIFSFFWTTNSLLLVAMFSKGDFPKAHVTNLNAAVGFALSLLWWGIHTRMLGHVRRHEALTIRLETRIFGKPSEWALSEKVNPRDYDRYARGFFSTRTLMSWTPKLTTSGWFAMFAYGIAH